MESGIKFSIFTSTYNRRDTIHRVWESLNKQTYKNFEWILIDNCSIDNIKELLDSYKKEARFPVNLIYNKQNMGFSQAFNKAVGLARGEFFIPADSDDSFESNSLESFLRLWESIPINQRKNYSGVNVLCDDFHTHHIIGDKFPADCFISNNLELHYKYQVKGEKWGMIRTDLLKKFHFPENKMQSGYIQDNYIWFRLAHEGYKVLCVNIVLRHYYIDTHNSIIKETRQFPISFAVSNYIFSIWNLNANLRFLLSESKKRLLIKDIINLIRYGLASDKTFGSIYKDLKERKLKILYLLFYPMGYFFYLKTYKNRITK